MVNAKFKISEWLFLSILIFELNLCSDEQASA